MEIKSFQDLVVWQKAKDLTLLIYLNTAQFPKEELFGITSQIRRATISISNNIVEGNGRQYKKDTLQFLYISNGSLNEVHNMILLCEELGFIEKIKHKK